MPPLQEVDPNLETWTQRTTSKKRGPKPTPYKDRKPKGSKPILRKQNSYSQRKKDKVIMWLIHHRVRRHGEDVPPSLRDAVRHFQIPKSTIQGWKSFSESHIEEQRRQRIPKWPGLEEELYKLFLERRARNRVVTTSWCRRQARSIFKVLYPSLPDRFIFSKGWWRGFLRRHNIVKRRIMKQATKRPEDYIEIMNSFLQFTRRVSTIKTQSRAITMILNSPKCRFPRRLVLNLDETPIPFEYLDTDEYVDRIKAEKGEDYTWTVSDKRVMVTCVISSAPKRLNSLEGIEMVKKAFLNCEISIRTDGTEDCFIDIKDISSNQINFTDWETAPEIEVKEDVVDQLCDTEELLEADDDELLWMTRYHEEVVIKLKERLKGRGLKVSGKKADLIRRLQEDDSQRSRSSEVKEVIYVG